MASTNNSSLSLNLLGELRALSPSFDLSAYPSSLVGPSQHDSRASHDVECMCVLSCQKLPTWCRQGRHKPVNLANLHPR